MSSGKAREMPRSVLITGCANPRGAGAALAREFHSRGWHVFATCRPEASSSTANSRTAANTTQEARVPRGARHRRAAPGRDIGVVDPRGRRGGRGGHGRLDVLVNNAARFALRPVADVVPDDARALFDTNVFGVLAVTQAFLPLLMAGSSGVVVNVSSISADCARRFRVPMRRARRR
jgi:1-acylglycerone phosphate reductase